jgi:hypothetical protein
MFYAQADMSERWSRGMATHQVQVLADTMQVKPVVQTYNLNAVHSPKNLQNKVFIM